MTEKLRRALMLLALAVFVLPTGCAGNRQLDQRSPSEVFLDVVSGFFEESEYERYDRVNNENLAKRRKWQCENLTVSELSELGVKK